MNEKIVEQLTDSIGQYDNGDPFNVVHFTVTAYQGRNYLYKGTPLHGTVIAECINGDYKERYGSLHGWLSKILIREYTRLQSIDDSIDDLTEERRKRSSLISSIKECGIS